MFSSLSENSCLLSSSKKTNWKELKISLNICLCLNITSNCFQSEFLFLILLLYMIHERSTIFLGRLKFHNKLVSMELFKWCANNHIKLCNVLVIFDIIAEWKYFLDILFTLCTTFNWNTWKSTRFLGIFVIQYIINI